MLTDDDRALGHRLAADFLEPLGGVDAVTLAAHRRRADQPAEAARWYVQAARDELHANDFAGAMARVAEAMACAPTGETLGAARLLEAEATMYRGDIPASVRAARDAMEAVRADSGSWSQALGYLIYGLSVLGRDAEIEPYLPRLVEATPKDADALLAVVIAQCQAAYSLQQRGHYAEALEFTQRAEAVAGGASRDEPLVVGRVSALRAFLEVHEGDLPEAVRRYSEAAHAYTRVGYSRRACGMRISLGFTYLQMGAYDEARTELLRAIVQAEKLGLGHVAATARHNLGLVLARTGEGAAALRVEREARAALEAEGDVRLAGTARCYLAQILAAAGAAGEAEAEARAAVAALDAFPPLLAQALAVLARLLLDRGAVAQARAEAQRGLALLDALGQVEEGEALLRLVAAEALAASGEHQAARAAIGVARDRILERAARLSDEAYRGQFLVMVPENARTLELAAQWEA
jgi:tetratricopeptide (TPR) repeat protein